MPDGKKESHWLQSSLCDKSLRLTWEINQATSKCQIDFWIKLAKKSKVEK